MSLMKELSIEAEDDLRDKIAEALTDYVFTVDDAEHIADSCDIPWEWLLECVNSKFTTWADWAKDFHGSFAEP